MECPLKRLKTLWRRNCRGERYAQFPPVYEFDEQTGLLTQKLMDNFGLIPQDILRSAISEAKRRRRNADLYQKITEGEEPQQEVENTASDTSDVNVNDSSTQEIKQNPTTQETTSTSSSQTVEERWEELAQQLIDDVNNIGRISPDCGQLIVESCQRWEATVPQDKRWDSISNILRHDTIALKHLSNYAYNHNPQWRETWGANLANYHSFEQELAWVDTDVRNDALVSMGFDIPATVEVKTGNLQNRQGKVIGLNGDNINPILVKVEGFNHYFHWTELEVIKETARSRFYTSVEELQEEYLEEPEESDLELEMTPLDKGIDALIQGNWEDIRNIFNQHPEIKEQAWSALSRKQKPQGLDGVEIALYDHVEISNEIRFNPQDFGLTNVNDPCQPVFPVEPICSAPDEFYFWDEYHPTRRVHQIIGEDMAQFVASHQVKSVPESSNNFGLLVFLGLLGTGLIYNRR